MSKKNTQSSCLYCKIDFLYDKYASRGKYCSNRCQIRFQRATKIASGKAGWAMLKTHILEESDGSCEICGTSEWLGKKILLIIDHIDGNSDNNNVSNLRAICSNCDATLDTYKAKNIGNGRHSRMNRYHSGKSF